MKDEFDCESVHEGKKLSEENWVERIKGALTEIKQQGEIIKMVIEKKDMCASVLNLLLSADIYFTKLQIRKHLQRIYGKPITSSSVYNTIHHLRGEGYYIDCVYKRGYKLIKHDQEF